MSTSKQFNLDEIFARLKVRKREEPAQVINLPPGRFLDEGVYLCEALHGPISEVSKYEQKRCIETLSSWGAGEPLVFFDLETTGLSGGTGTYAFLAGIGIFQGDSFTVRQLFLCSPKYEQAWLSKLLDIIPGKPAFVTYNGKNFDLPLINTRLLLSRMKPFEETKHLDLLYLTRRLWKRRIGSCSLSNVERQILNIERESDDIPGRFIPDLYMTFLKTGDAATLHGVFYHNEMDIISLCNLFYRVAFVLSGQSHDPHEVNCAGDAWYRHDLDQAKFLWTKAALLEPPAMEALWKLAMESKRRNNYTEALSLLTKLYGMGYRKIDVAVEISKIYEHKLKDAHTALSWADKAMMDFLQYRPLAMTWQNKQSDLSKRLERLKRKLGAL